MLMGIDGVLNARDAVGAVREPIYFVTRQWYTDVGKTVLATQPEGYATDSTVQILPSPGIKEFSQDIRLKEGGSIKAGDIILQAISRNLFTMGQLDGSTPNKGVQIFYMLGVKLYQVINVTENYVTFDVQIRELSNQTRY